MANFVVSAHMTKGDVLPFLRFSAALKKRGHRVTLVTHGAFGPLAHKAGIEFRELDPPEQYKQIMKDLYMLENPLTKPDLYAKYEEIYYAQDKLQKEYDILSELCQAPDSVLICREMSGFIAMMVSEKLGVPIIAGFLAPSYVTQLQTWADLSFDFSISLINRFREHNGLAPVKDWLSWAKAIQTNIGFWPEEYASREPEWGFDVEPVGFPLADEAELEPLPESLVTFLESGEPPLLITGGTGKLLKSNFYEVCVEACRLTGQRAIIVTQHEELLPAELPDNMQWYSVLPLAAVYPLLGSIIHHGGIGTVSGSMAGGVPQLALAADTDRPDNGKRVKNLGLGEYLPPALWEPHLIADALKRIASPHVKERCMQMKEIMHNHDTMEYACGVAERIVGQKSFAISSERLALDYAAAASEMTAMSQTAATAESETVNRIMQSSAEQRAKLIQQLLRKRKELAGVQDE
ncbi:glycosyltransferase [Paenibacillus sp. MMS18-CY102]|uniref:glycosyltransferase n=1 Tax=Paenibacillus sp. MMS18-CY102 TaxID=2682849 RepID=UPI0013660331|nr:nucleotide disphospho-sugar-binding domain-containing protein [Paenibacillus sp. MMS18-CY102]MWC27751.1 hypothetical protein [Paenibacillus sp. MMS18-CY102]